MATYTHIAQLTALSACIVHSAMLTTSLADGQRHGVARAPTAHHSVKEFLQAWVGESRCDDDRTTRYLDAFVDLDGDKKDEVVVYLIGACWCGSGGCTTLVLAPEASTYRLVSEISITRPPIRVLKRVSRGWRSLGVWVQGGGIQPGYEAVLRFDGSTYPRNPSTAPTQGRAPRGRVLIGTLKGARPLYP
jgi:hypothetical protein